jgi:hypothetical protein
VVADAQGVLDQGKRACVSLRAGKPRQGWHRGLHGRRLEGLGLGADPERISRTNPSD